MPDQVPPSVDMASANIQAPAPEAKPEPADFQPRDNPAFILHGKLKTSFGEVCYSYVDVRIHPIARDG